MRYWSGTIGELQSAGKINVQSLCNSLFSSSSVIVQFVFARFEHLRRSDMSESLCRVS
jgi:hypothetical protein